jgi:hypothetical protein
VTHDPQWEDETVIHVPPCHQALGHWAGGCQCAVIAQVRAETLEACIAAVEKLSVPAVGGRWEIGAEAFQSAALYALRDLRQP